MFSSVSEVCTPSGPVVVTTECDWLPIVCVIVCCSFPALSRTTSSCSMLYSKYKSVKTIICQIFC